jgi:hypothetical protein
MLTLVFVRRAFKKMGRNSDVQEMNMSAFIHNAPPLEGNDIQVAGSITSEDAGFYTVLISAIIFMVAALTGHLA